MKTQTPGTAWLAGMACLLLLPFLSSCKKDKTDPVQPGPITLHFDNVVGASVGGADPKQLELNTGWNTNAAGDSFRVTKLQYYISNVKLKKDDGTWFTVPQDSSYFLVREDIDLSQDCDISNVPAGNYVAVQFTVGVDSARSRADVSRRTGALDPADTSTGGSMYWDWNPGYIFYRFEGVSPAVPVGGMMGNDHVWQLHVGGYGGTAASPTLNNNRTVTLTFPATAIVNSNRHPEVHTYHDISKTLNGPGVKVSFATLNMLHSIVPASGQLADNYAQAFVVGHVHND